MHITRALSVDLALLTQALDQPEVDLVQTLQQLAADARLAVRSYLGLGLSLTAGDTPFLLAALEENAAPEDIRGSLRMPSPIGGVDDAEGGCALVLYAARAGAFLDLAADLSWLTGVELSEYPLDQHLSIVAYPSTANTVHTDSVINQAIGVLIGRGHPPDEAHKKLTAQAIEVGTDRYTAAVRILRTLATGTE